jgi:hypothetical protein
VYVRNDRLNIFLAANNIFVGLELERVPILRQKTMSASERRIISASPGVDVMITIFWDFRQFSEKKLAFFSKINVMVNFLNNLALL